MSAASLTDTPDLSDARVRRQWDLEERMLDAGASAYRRRLDKAAQRGEAASAGATRRFVTLTVAPLTAAIGALMAHAASGAPGVRSIAVHKLQGVGPEVAAFITASTAFNRAHRTLAVQTVAIDIAARIEDEARLNAFAVENAGLVAHVLGELNKQTAHRGHKRTVLVYLLNQRGDAWVSWSREEKLHLGCRLLDLLFKGTGAFHKQTTRRGHRGKDITTVEIEGSLLTSLREEDARLACVAPPAYMPMVVPPRPWTSPRSGGYLVGRPVPLRFVKRSAHKRESERPLRLTPDSAPLVYAAANAVQATPWRVNRRLLPVLREAWERKMQIGLPPADDAPVPPSPGDFATNEPARRGWKIAAKLTYLGNVRARSKRRDIVQTLALAAEYQDDPEIYFPHQLDFRGRLYAVAAYLNPQGSDPARALLEFAEGKPIVDGVAAGWLAVHGANLYGHDKVSLEDRVSWVEERNALIARTAADPFADLWWGDADKPWSFLAWCMEWAQWLEQGEGFVSHLPIALDGSCNGLQHYSALLRDPIGGAATNLIPRGTTPADIYGEVAKVVMDRLSDSMTVDGCGSLADRWFNFGIDRKITKRPVMVLPYGGTQIACHRYVEDAYRDKVAAGTPDPFTDADRREALTYLSSLVWSAIGDVVVAARQAMAWLRKAARIAAKAGQPLTWTAPSGFPVVQDYRDLRSRRIKTRLSGAITLLTLTEETDKIDAARQANGLPPNFIHSLDAAALCHTVDLATGNGIRHFAMIHDSYGTHAASTDMLAQCLRAAFVEMYETNDPLADLERRLRETLPAEYADQIPSLPPRGTLDLREVLRSDFFFS